MEILPLGPSHSFPTSFPLRGHSCVPPWGFLHTQEQPHSGLPNPPRQPTSNDRLIQEYKGLVPLPHFRKTPKQHYSVLPNNWLRTWLQLYHCSISSSARSWLHSLTGPVAKSIPQGTLTMNLHLLVCCLWQQRQQRQNLMTTVTHHLYFTTYRAFITSSHSHHNSRRQDEELLLFPLCQ